MLLVSTVKKQVIYLNIVGKDLILFPSNATIKDILKKFAGSRISNSSVSRNHNKPNKRLSAS
uniref:Uncharacterized protein n=1 Tax=Rhizophora mucronata TaxID=61149 RepID=A0A2P2IWV7_RHIMU